MSSSTVTMPGTSEFRSVRQNSKNLLMGPSFGSTGVCKGWWDLGLSLWQNNKYVFPALLHLREFSNILKEALCKTLKWLNVGGFLYSSNNFKNYLIDTK